MITRGELKSAILGLVNKSSRAKGNYTDAKLEDGILEAMRFLSVMMHLEGNGWQNKFKHISVPANSLFVPLPADVVLVNQVRINTGNGLYTPMTYDAGYEASSPDPTTSTTQYPTSYKLMDNCIYFNAGITASATTIEIEHTAFPSKLYSDGQKLPAHISDAFIEFIKYRGATTCRMSVGESSTDWAEREAQWYSQVQAIIAKRRNSASRIRDFE